MKDLLEQFTPQDFIATLPEPSRSFTSEQFAAGINPLVIAHKIAYEPGEGLVTKGGELWPNDFLPKILTELQILLCTNDSKYQDLRKTLNGEVKISATVVSYAISNAIAVYVGMVAAICYPLVAMLLAAAVKISLEAWCKQVSESLSPTLQSKTQNLTDDK